MKRSCAYSILLSLAAAPLVCRAAELTAGEKETIDKALPAKAAVNPKRLRKLLLLNVDVNDTGRRPTIEPSMPYGNYAIITLGERTGAYTTAFSSNSMPSALTTRPA